MTIFGKARAGENLSPAARSFLRLVEGLAATAIVAALPVVSDALSRGVVDWADVGRAALAAASTAVLLAVLKYAKAHADAPLPPSLASVAPVSAPVPAADSSDAPDPFAPLVLPDTDATPAPAADAPATPASA